MKPHTLTAFYLLLVFILTGAVLGEDTTGQTFGMQNGRFWNGLADDQAHALFLIGIFNGWKLREHTEDVVLGKVITAMSPCGSSFGELAEMVTTAYKEPENRILPVGWVLMASIQIECGRTTRDAVFPVLRKHLATMSGMTKGVSGSMASPIDAILSVSKQ